MSYVVVSLLSTVSAEAVEPVFDSLFALFGAPLVLKTDNGPPFQSKSFSDFATRQGFHHRKVTPEWPRANGEVEHFMRNLSKVARTAKINGTNREVELRSFLRAYRDTLDNRRRTSTPTARLQSHIGPAKQCPKQRAARPTASRPTTQRPKRL